jgi:hypothetical protein
MFKEEIEESIGYIQYLKGSCEQRFNNAEITPYVYNENNSFLSQEIAGLKRFLADVNATSGSAKTPEELVSSIRNTVRQRLKGYEDPEAVYLIIDKKLEKILKYLKIQHDV